MHLVPRAIACTLALCASASLRGETPPSTVVVLSGKVLGASGRHPVRVALWAQAGFLTRPYEQLTFLPGTPPSFKFRVAPGRWALSAFEDRNGNGELDMGVFGPKEPSGFFRPFHAWRKPRFDDIAFIVRADMTDADVTLK
jgi:uncharacterized protein (DUF2141 family)